ncbi:putative N-acetyltransferase YsnE [Rhodobacteraceae bacterium THAF1]|uniref:GNAT family N-acetyltransferase n=1 Tax=Palleronia sp. THAF1 TaxID=2587842 RepID=UPI000F3BCC5E|nr:GNAT family N-acetyltransferase [Palleronia sp. THAF1]QFU09214.1 putative N-acetyltransferase YsnE [Palleronia sp. THAF1]VDC27337.1 putative N-acetyltransferase YsnE [Rhodobacteraceae bacterium THAF1]
MNIAPAHLSDPAVLALLSAHVAHCDGSSPAESNHRLEAAALDRPEITVLGAWKGADLAGIGALMRLSAQEGEIKSMHTAASHRGRGVARAILVALIAQARADGLTALLLETGSNSPFAAARALYEAHGFKPTSPFANYGPDPWSVFYALSLMDAA